MEASDAEIKRRIFQIIVNEMQNNFDLQDLQENVFCSWNLIKLSLKFFKIRIQ